MGELSAQESAEVEAHLLRYPELRAELEKIEEAQEGLLTRAAIKPQASVKTNLFKSLDNKDEKKASTLIALEGRNTRFWKYAVAASITLALATSYLAYDYRGKWQQSERSLDELIAQNQHFAQDYNTVNERLGKLESDLKISNDPSFKRVVLSGTANAPEATASVFWNPQTREVYLSIQNLKAIAQENQFQLWAIVDGKPVDAGVFDAGDASGFLAMNTIEGATAFAITIEPRGGKPSPTLENMQVIGEVGG
jgi:anti-sigma-K factor RskA